MINKESAWGRLLQKETYKRRSPTGGKQSAWNRLTERLKLDGTGDRAGQSAWQRFVQKHAAIDARESAERLTSSTARTPREKWEWAFRDPTDARQQDRQQTAERIAVLFDTLNADPQLSGWAQRMVERLDQYDQQCFSKYLGYGPLLRSRMKQMNQRLLLSYLEDLQALRTAGGSRR